MVIRWTAASAIASLLFVATAPGALACNTKTGKDCDATVGHKTVYSKKVGKPAPIGGVGATSHMTGFDPLGLPSFTVAPAPSVSSDSAVYGDNPAGWFYLSPNNKAASGLSTRPIAFAVLDRLSQRAASTTGRALVNSDGTLTQAAISGGWVRLAAPAPVIPVGVPSPQIAIQAPGFAPIQAPSLQQSVAPPTPHPSGIVAPNLLAGHLAAGEPHVEASQFVEVHHATTSGVYRYGDAVTWGDPTFHFVVIGIKEPN